MANAILVIEVSDTSLKYDRDTKLPMYAEAGIREVWIVNLEKDVVEVHHEPNLGLYQRTDIFGSGQTISSTVLPEAVIAVNDILS